MTICLRPCLAAFAALTVPAFADSPFRPYGAAHFAIIYRWDPQTTLISEFLSWNESGRPTGVWDISASVSNVPLVSHHSVVLPDAISVNLSTSALHEPGQPDNIETRGHSLFFLEFQVTETIPHPVFVSGGANMLLSMMEPPGPSWNLSASQVLPDLQPGYYNFTADTANAASQVGTLFLPTPGAALLLPIALIAARRRR